MKFPLKNIVNCLKQSGHSPLKTDVNGICALGHIHMHYYYYLFDLRDTSANHNHLTSDNINLHHIPAQSTSQEFSRGGLLTEQEARLVLGLSIGYMDR